MGTHLVKFWTTFDCSARHFSFIFGEHVWEEKLTRTQVVRVQNGSKGAGEALAGSDTEGDGDVVDGLDVVFDFDDGVEAFTGLDGVWNGDANDPSRGEGEQGSSGSEGGSETHDEDCLRKCRKIGR